MVAMATTFMNDKQQARLIFFGEAALHQSLRDFEGDSRAAELLVGIFASGLIGIDDRVRFGNAIRSGQVMVGDDEIDAEAMRGFRGGEGANAHIDADDEANAGGGGALDHVVAHIVAFANAVRDVEVGSASAEFDGRFQNDDGHGAVDVVIAVDQDGIFAFDGCIEAIDGAAQAGHVLGRVQMIKRRSEKARGGVGIGQAAADEQARQRASGDCRAARHWRSITAVERELREIAEGCSQGLHLRWIFCSQFPAHGSRTLVSSS